MKELGLICKQPGSYAYKTATVEQPDIPNRLNREFTPGGPNQSWCGDITYIWAGSRWTLLTSREEEHQGCCSTQVRAANMPAASLGNDCGVITLRKA